MQNKVQEQKMDYDVKGLYNNCVTQLPEHEADSSRICPPLREWKMSWLKIPKRDGMLLIDVKIPVREYFLGKELL